MEFENGSMFLKLRSMSRPNLLKEFASMSGLNLEGGIKSKQWLKVIFEQNPPEIEIEKFVKEKFADERNIRKNDENFLYSQLYRLNSLDWGGLYQNALEKTIVNNYIKKIMDLDELNRKIETEIHTSMAGYVRSSWYNNWTSILIEDMFKEHKNVLPAIGKVKNMDFFWDGIPLDLKVTFFPAEYMKSIRIKNKLKSELSVLKSFARMHGIDYNSSGKEKIIFNELLAKITESQLPDAKKFIVGFKEERRTIVESAVKNPQNLAIWLYENQGERRFDSANRFYLILVNSDDMEQSWKLKRNRDVLPDKIRSFLDGGSSDKMMKINFNWKGSKYEAKCFVLFIVI